MKKYILTYSLISLLSSQAVFAKAQKNNLIDFDFYIGKTFIYNEQIFNQKYNVDTATPIPNTELKTKSDLAILNLDHKFGAKILFNLNWDMKVGLEVQAINPENYAKEGLISSSYIAKEAKLSDFIHSTANFNSFYFNTLSLLSFIPCKFTFDNSKKLSEITLLEGETLILTKFRVQDVKYELRNKIEKFSNTNTNKGLDEKNTSDRAKMNLIKEELNSYIEKNRDIFYDADRSRHLDKNILKAIEESSKNSHKFNDLKIRQAVKSVFITPSLYYAMDLYDNFNVYAGIKAGYGHLSIMQEFNDLQTISTKGDNYKFAIHSNQESYTWTGGVELGSKYVISDLFQAGVSFHVNAYGNLDKPKLNLIVLDETINKKRDSLSYFGISTHDKENKSIFGPMDVTTSFNLIINL